MQLTFLQEDLQRVLQDSNSSPRKKPQRPQLPLAAKKPAAKAPMQLAAEDTSPPAPQLAPAPMPEKSPSAFKTISEVANIMNVPQHVLRFWESQFSQIKPLKLAGGRRYYRPEDIKILSKIQHLLYKQGYTIKGAKKAFGKEGDDTAPERPALAQKIPAIPMLPQGKQFSEKQLGQIAAIKSELIGLKAALEAYI